MNSRKNLEKYFRRNDTAYVVGLALLVVAFFALLIGRTIYYIIGFVCAPVGLVMFFVGSIGRVTQDDIDKAVSDLLWEYDKPLHEDVRLAKRLAPHHDTVKFSQYDYEGEGLLTKKGKDGAWRTSQHTAMTLMFLRDGIIYIKKTVFPLEDYSGHDHSITESAELKFENLEKAEIVRDTVVLNDLKHQYNVVRARLQITGHDGKTLLIVQVNDDLSMDRLAETINRGIKNGHL